MFGPVYLGKKMEPRKSKKILNQPDIPKPDPLEELAFENHLLAQTLSKIKYYAEYCKQHMSEQELEVIRKYAK